MARMIVNALRTSNFLRNRSVCEYHRSVSIFRNNFSTETKSNVAKEYILDSPLTLPQPIPNQNLIEFVFENYEDVAEETALTCGVTGRSYNYGMTRLMINRFAQAVLSHCGMRPRETIGLLLPNIPEYIVACYGALEAGLTVTFVNPLYTADEIRRQFQNAEVKLIATVPQLLDVATGVGEQLLDYRGTVCIGGEDDVATKVFGFKSLLTAGYEAELPGINPREMAILPYSSGTTGLPKGVMLSHHNLVSNLVQTDLDELKLDFDKDAPITIFTVLPFFHIYGFNTILNLTLRLKKHLVSIPRFTPEDYLNCLLTYKPKLLFVVPSLINFLADNSMVTEQHLESVARIQSGAAPLTEGLKERFRKKFGDKIKLSQGYGMTESSPTMILVPNNAPVSKHGTIGVLVPETVAKIIDVATGDSLGPNTPGELVVKGPQVMMGYLNNEKATKETIDEDGWLHTGDIAYYDEDKYFYVIDRCKELIKVKGNQVSPTELENLLLEIPEIQDAAVVGVPDALADEVPRAFIVRKPDTQITDIEIIKYVNARVVHYKKLAGGIAFVNIIPRNPSGKILRNELKSNECKYVIS